VTSATDGIQFSVLGPLDARIGDRMLPLGGPKQRAVLALLLLGANDTVPLDRLIDRIWGDEPPASAAHTIEGYVSRLRKAIDPHGSTLVRRGRGYTLNLGRATTDVQSAEHLLAEAEASSAAGRHHESWELATRGLQLWRGRALADVPLPGEAAGLEELRMRLLEQRFEAGLELGRHAEVATEVQPLVHEHPYRERLVSQLMLSLYRAERQAEALAVYQRTRRLLAEDLGLKPSRELQRLSAEIVRQEPQLTPPAATLAPNRPVLRATTLPAMPTPFVGRERELAEVLELLTRPDVRLLTLTGAGGTGKTRLAVRAAGKLASEYADGVCWVPLASQRDPTLVLEQARQALGARGDLAQHIGPRRVLLLFDNFEQVLEAGTDVAALRATCPNLDLLVTSREPLHVAGEHLYSVAVLGEDDAVALFAARARAVDPHFEVDDAVPEICRRLDRLPLALELAAARVKALSSSQILERLDRRLPLLTHGPRDAPERHRTFRAAIEWSYELLGPEEKRLFARLSVFRGGWTLADAEDVVAADLDTVQSLVDKSLLNRDGERFSMLETVCDYAAELLERLGEAGDTGRCHALHFLALAEEAEPHLRGSPGAWLHRLDQEHDNLRAALDYLEASGESHLALRLAAALSLFWATRGHLVEGRRRLAEALHGDSRATLARARALNGVAVLASAAGDATTAKQAAEDALELHLGLADAQGIARSKFLLGQALADHGDALGAQALFDESRQAFRDLGDDHYALLATFALAWTYEELGDRECARALDEENLAQARVLQNERMTAIALRGLASYALDEGQSKEALSMLAESTRIASDLGEVPMLAAILCEFAAALAAEGRPRKAARLLGCSEAVHGKLGASARTWLSQLNDRTVAAIQAQIDERDLAELWQEGRRLTIDDAVSLALASVGEHASTR
jgi:predicted ATPase/DNA-binding SARP family transcriptional activator